MGATGVARWSGRRSDDTCSSAPAWALPGFYHVYAAALGSTPTDVQFEVTRAAAKVVTRAYHLYAIPRFVNRWAVSLAYLTDAVFDRSVVSLGLASQEDAQFSASEGIPMPKAI